MDDGGPLFLTLLNSRSNIAREKSKPALRNPKTTMWILATSATKPMMHRTNNRLMTKRTKGMSMTPPPGAIISWIMDIVVMVVGKVLLRVFVVKICSKPNGCCDGILNSGNSNL